MFIRDTFFHEQRTGKAILMRKGQSTKNEPYVRAFIRNKEGAGFPVPYRSFVLLSKLYNTRIPRWEKGQIVFK